ncbi:cell wall hydrolase [Candidatus Saccharibacteria bacterium]|nr:cell wall hydrolase [Candidatus Saccharibacteria bacterium]
MERRKERLFQIVTIVVTITMVAALAITGITYYNNHDNSPYKAGSGAGRKTASIAMGAERKISETAEEPLPFSEEEIAIMAKVLCGEADYEYVLSEAERSMVVWCILNRYDANLYGDKTIEEICLRPGNFAYKAENPISVKNYNLVIDVIQRWMREKAGEQDVGRTLPSEYLYFCSNLSIDDRHNYFYKFTEVVNGEKVWFGCEPLTDPYEEH